MIDRLISVDDPGAGHVATDRANGPSDVPNRDARPDGGTPGSQPTPQRSGSRHTGSRRVLLMSGIAVALSIMILISAGIGQLTIPPTEVLGSLLRAVGIANPWPMTHPHGEAALWTIRFPRVVLAVVVGAALGVGGAVMQGVFGNPLAEPGIVGVSSGAAVGACAAIVFGFGASAWTTPMAAFAGGLVAMALVYTTARQGGRTEVVTLILTGVAVNAVAGAGIALLTFLGDSQAREQIVFWQMGSMNGSRWQHVAVALPIAAAAIVGSLLIARQLDLLALGERSARHLGVRVERLRAIAIVLVALLTCAGVAFCGIIAFVGLVVPHLVRMIIGPAHLSLIIASALGGSLVLLIADLGARTIVPYADLPIGMLTALVGGPFFFYLIRRTRNGAGGWT